MKCFIPILHHRELITGRIAKKPVKREKNKEPLPIEKPDINAC